MLKKPGKLVDNIVKKWNQPFIHILSTAYHKPVQTLSGRF